MIGACDVIAGSMPSWTRQGNTNALARATPRAMNVPLLVGWRHAALDVELALLVDCCRANFAGSTDTPPTPETRQVDWSAFAALAARHRVEGLAREGLRAMGITPPPSIEAALADQAREIADQGLRAAMLSRSLADAFASAGQQLLFLKGLVVGQCAYGHAFRKRSWDIDILVLPQAILPAAALLKDLGLHCVLPSQPSDAALVRWHRLSKESVWASADGSLHVELHSRLSDHSGLLTAIDACAPHRTVWINDHLDLTTLAATEQFAYLAVHGASSAWFRLKWIADLAGILHGSSEEELLALLTRADALGAGRPARQALLLASWLFPLVAFDSPLGRSLRKDRLANWLARRSLAQLVAGEPTERLLGTLMIHVTQPFLAPGLARAVREVWRMLVKILRRRTFAAN